MTKLFAFIILIFSSSISQAENLTCLKGVAGINHHEIQLLKYGGLLPSKKDMFMKKAKRPLACLIKIYLSSQGLEKVIAHNTLKPFLGGPVTKGMPENINYKKIYRALKGQSLIAPSFAMAIGKAHASATWEFYRMFCDEHSEENNLYCAEMLPSPELVKNQGMFESLSSILMMKYAFKNLEGQPAAQKKVKKKLMQVKDLIKEEDQLLQRALLEELHMEIKKQKVHSIPLSERWA